MLQSTNMSNNGKSIFDLGESRDDENRNYPEDDPVNMVNFNVKQLNGTTSSLRIHKETKLHELISTLEKKHNPKGGDFTIKVQVDGHLKDVDMTKESQTLKDLGITSNAVVVMEPDE
ncbi:hypothetical protein BC937DRAFT_87743 [Endogone sp. FLAS-F59071]|nr:hypothetical protein BC937DRAFT_87743 [Endogone sp. FLAS-F59071]|eukprot:RUS19272.1 hypothetical protein BC937DRAFT_87743 [Endogone sp. FLAS-F59071]